MLFGTSLHFQNKVENMISREQKLDEYQNMFLAACIKEYPMTRILEEFNVLLNCNKDYTRPEDYLTTIET